MNLEQELRKLNISYTLDEIKRAAVKLQIEAKQMNKLFDRVMKA